MGGGVFYGAGDVFYGGIYARMETGKGHFAQFKVANATGLNLSFEVLVLRLEGPEEIHGASAVAEVGGVKEGAFYVGFGGGDRGQGFVAQDQAA